MSETIRMWLIRNYKTYTATKKDNHEKQQKREKLVNMNLKRQPQNVLPREEIMYLYFIYN